MVKLGLYMGQIFSNRIAFVVQYDLFDSFCQFLDFFFHLGLHENQEAKKIYS